MDPLHYFLGMAVVVAVVAWLLLACERDTDDEVRFTTSYPHVGGEGLTGRSSGEPPED